MILQERGDSKVVYMDDIDAGHIVLGESMGMCDIHGKPALHAQIRKVKYTTDCGVTLDAWEMAGETVTMYVLPAKVPIDGNKGADMARALNSFNSPMYKFDNYVFTGKFNAREGQYTVEDKMKRRMSLSSEQLKDFPGIFDLMANIGKDNGRLFAPVIARYMWTIYHFRGKPSKFQPVGYLDLKQYLQVIRDDRRNMFSTMYGTAQVNIQLGKKPAVRVTDIDKKTGQAILQIEDAVVIDMEKDRTFKPFVLVANRPFEIREEMQFRWARVEYEGHAVFLMPVMSVAGTWRNMLNMIDLLSPRQ